MTNIKYITVITLILSVLICSCGNSRKETVKDSNMQMEVNDSISENGSANEITPEMAFEGVSNYCHEEYDWSIAKDNPDIMSVQMGEESEAEYQVVFRSYTGALVHFYVDKLTGKTKIVESVPSMNIKAASKREQSEARFDSAEREQARPEVNEEKGTIDLHDYLGKGRGAKVASSNKESLASKTSLTGIFVSDYDGSTLNITARGDGGYDVVIDLFRLTSLDDGVGTDADGGIDFTATDAAGEPIGGRITFDGDVATLTFVHSTWPLIENGTKWEFKRK